MAENANNGKVREADKTGQNRTNVLRVRTVKRTDRTHPRT